MSKTFPRDELATLLERLTEGQISPVGHARLAKILRGDAQARARYRKVMGVHALLQWREKQTPELSFFPVGVLEEQNRMSPGAQSSASMLKSRYWREHRAKFAALALTLTVLFWAGFYTFVSQNKPDNGGGADGVSENYIARVSGERGASWAPDAAALAPGDTLGSGQRIELEAGYLEITFAQEAVVVLEGPAVFLVDNSRGGTLERGRLVARIDSSQARDFSIATPLAQIIDLGTEFGVESSSQGGTVVEVFQGKVEATPYRRGDDHRVHPRRLTAGQVASLATDSSDFLLRGESEPLQFVQKLPVPGEPLPEMVITPVAVECSVVSEGNHPAERLIDGSGFQSFGPLESRRHVSAIFNAEHIETQRNYWIGQWGEGPVVLTFDLGRLYDLSSLWVWNYRSSGQADIRSVTRLRYSVSADGENFTEMGEEDLLNLLAEPGVEGQAFPLAAQGRYVRVEILDIRQPDESSEVSLGEVRFYGRPNKPVRVHDSD